MSLFNHRTLVLHPDFAGLEDFMISLPLRFELPIRVWIMW